MNTPSTHNDSPPIHIFLLQASFSLADGQAQHALRIAEDGLRRFPDNAEICNLAGVCAASAGNPVRAEHHWRRTIALNPGDAQAHYNLGLLHAKHQQLQEAEQYYRQAVELDPNNTAALSNLGNLLAGMQRDQDAEPYYRRLLALDPDNAAIHSNLGTLLARRNADEEAEQCYRRAIALDPKDAKAFSNLGILLARSNRLEEAEQCYLKAISLDPAAAETYTNLGILLEERQRYTEAELCHRQAITLNPDYAAVHANLGNLLTRLRREVEAEACYHQALSLDPGSTLAHTSLGVLFSNLGREQEAEACFRRAVAIDPGYDLARLNLGYLLLRQGRFAEGWLYHEARHDPPGTPSRSKFIYPVDVSFPQWRGEALAGKSLLVWPEQGLGDEIQFCRYLPLLKQQGAARITLVCKPPLKTLMETLEGVDAVVAADRADAVAEHDYWTYPLSIPLHLQTTLDTIPAALPYLRTPLENSEHWSARLPHDGLLVGLIWKGNHRHDNDRYRSLPDLTTLAPLWGIPGVRFISLQKGQGEDEARNPPGDQPLLHLGDELTDFADTAAVIEQLDLVISVDTAVAHLAGALAKPCWVLLPAYRSDWRWLRGRNDSPWYPRVMRLFRQADHEDWASTIQEIKNALQHIHSLWNKP